jgi:hypothetical protein
MKMTLLAGSLLLLVSCASYDEPYSLLGATRTSRTSETIDIGIERVDGVSPMSEPIRLKPGKHEVTVSMAGSNAVSVVTLDLAPCLRYWIVGGRQDATGKFTVKVDRTDPIPGCKAQGK